MAKIQQNVGKQAPSGASPLRFEAPRRGAWKKFCRAAENSRTAASPRGIRRYFFTSCEEIARRVAAALFLHEMSGNTKNRKYSLLFQKESDSKTKGAGNYREARKVPPARRLRCSAKSQHQRPTVQSEKPAHRTPCTVHTHGVCLAFRRLAVHGDFTEASRRFHGGFTEASRRLHGWLHGWLHGSFTEASRKLEEAS